MTRKRWDSVPERTLRQKAGKSPHQFFWHSPQSGFFLQRPEGGKASDEGPRSHRLLVRYNRLPLHSSAREAGRWRCWWKEPSLEEPPAPRLYYGAQSNRLRLTEH